LLSALFEPVPLSGSWAVSAPRSRCELNGLLSCRADAEAVSSSFLLGWNLLPVVIAAAASGVVTQSELWTPQRCSKVAS
jgi:hypothetical protein